MAKSDPFLGRLVAGRYEVVSRIGRGGMGAVYLARQQGLDRSVALKVIRIDLIDNEEIVLRFQREAKTIARLSHPHIVVVYDFGSSDSALYLVMEHLAGVSLAERLRQPIPLSLHSALAIASDVCAALDAAHRGGVVHRDLKPDNIMLLSTAGRSDYAKVLDFGIAKIIGGQEERPLTSSKVLLGTAGYVAPEVILNGMSDDPRTDLYALGAVLFEMLAGRAPFVTKSTGATLIAQTSQDAPSLLHLLAGVPDAVCHLVAQLLAREPAQRPRDADTVAVELQRLLAMVAPTEERPLSRAFAPAPVSIPPLSAGTASLFGAGPDDAGANATSSFALEVVNTAVMGSLSTAGTGTAAFVSAAAPAPPRSWPRFIGAAAGLTLAAAIAFGVRAAPSSAPTPAHAVAPAKFTRSFTRSFSPVIAPVEAVAVADAVHAVADDTKPVPPKKYRRQPSVPKEEIEPPAPAPAPALSSALVKQAIDASLGKATKCTNSNIRHAPTGSGLLIDHCPSYRTIEGAQQLSFTVAPDGTVLSARFLQGSIDSEPIAACVLQSLISWRLPPFAADAPVEIRQRVLFEPCVPINGVCVF